MVSFRGKNDYIIKRSPVVIVKNFILIQVGAVALFFLAGYFAYYAKIYRSLPLAKIVSFQIAELIFLFLCEIVLVFFTFFRWYKEYLWIQSDKIVYGKGVVFKRRTSIPITEVRAVTYQQGPLGRLTKYGPIEIRDKNSKIMIRIADMPEPQDLAEYILNPRSSPVRLAASLKIEDLLKNEENQNLEFKSSLRWDIKAQKVNRHLEKAVMKTIAAFLNSHGGYLVIGVDDSRQAVGVLADYATLQRQDADGFENHFNQVFNNMIGIEFRQHIQLSKNIINGKECFVVHVAPTSHPAYLRFDNNEEFYVRTGNITTSLKFSEAASYINSRFR